MSPYLKALARFRNKIDFEISKQSNAISFDFLLRNYAKGNFTDEDLIELRGYYKGLKVAREMLYRTINGVGTCLWASEIEEFPIAVTKRHFS